MMTNCNIWLKDLPSSMFLFFQCVSFLSVCFFSSSFSVFLSFQCVSFLPVSCPNLMLRITSFLIIDCQEGDRGKRRNVEISFQKLILYFLCCFLNWLHWIQSPELCLDEKDLDNDEDTLCPLHQEKKAPQAIMGLSGRYRAPVANSSTPEYNLHLFFVNFVYVAFFRSPLDHL